ncbi:MAG: hypothetical protein JWM80_1515 [Cyanobacteria bacterium RYN_339]|nr:hypothetical protein [Cyanobacteria bacterium RYN_339]
MAPTLAVDPHAPDEAAIAEAARILRAGGLVAFPTETVYGLGANALDEQAVARIYAAKGRPSGNPLIVHVADAAMARQVAAEWPDAAERLATACWPGPLTLVLRRGPHIPASVTAGLPAVGVRVPAHPVALALIRAAGVPIAAPSANPYTGVSPTTAAHVAAGLGDKVDLILDGGAATVGLESTVLDLTSAVPRVLRPGGMSLGRLRELLGEVAYEPITKADDVALPSPGLAKRHYAPRARVRILPDAAAVAREAARLERVGCWTFGPPPGEGVMMPREPEAYAARLYAELHEADRRGWAHLLVEAPPQDDAWAAVHDRLRRAASS